MSTVIDEFDFLQQVDPEKVSFLTLSTINRIRFIWLNHQKISWDEKLWYSRKNGLFWPSNSSGHFWPFRHYHLDLNTSQIWPILKSLKMHYLLNIILLSRWPWYPAVSWRWFEAAFSKHPCYFTQKHFSVAIDLWEPNHKILNTIT